MGVNKEIFEGLRLLYVEDEEMVREATADLLSNYFPKLLVAKDGDEALDIYRHKGADIVLSDIKMPGLNGLELAREIRLHDEHIPIILVSAHTETALLLEAVSLKLEEYLIKPYNFEKLLHRLQAIVEKLRSDNNRNYEFAPDCHYVYGKKAIVRHGEITTLSRRESDLLELLIEYKGMVATYGAIEERVYRGDPMSSDALKTLMKKLRKKLPEETITTIVTIGYQLP